MVFLFQKQGVNENGNTLSVKQCVCVYDLHVDI